VTDPRDTDDQDGTVVASITHPRLDGYEYRLVTLEDRVELRLYACDGDDPTVFEMRDVAAALRHVAARYAECDASFI
jgi:hypothetical protein